jgi:hypothetical protein
LLENFHPEVQPGRSENPTCAKNELSCGFGQVELADDLNRHGASSGAGIRVEDLAALHESELLLPEILPPGASSGSEGE